jgi:hypothetical protein
MSDPSAGKKVLENGQVAAFFRGMDRVGIFKILERVPIGMHFLKQPLQNVGVAKATRVACGPIVPFIYVQAGVCGNNGLG